LKILVFNKYQSFIIFFSSEDLNQILNLSQNLKNYLNLMMTMKMKNYYF